MEDKDPVLLGQILGMLGQADGWLARISPAAAGLQPAPGSTMSRDDELAHPYQVSHGAWSSLSHAVDHLHCLRTLLADARVIHMFAPYSLLRGALENACSAVWLLEPGARKERITRRLRLAVSDIQHGETARELTGQQGRRSRRDRLTEVAGIAQSAGICQQVKGVGYTEIVSAVSGPLKPGTAEFCWRLCSGFAHGDLWPTLAAAERTQLPGALPGVASLRISADLKTLLNVTTVTAMLSRKGWELYDQRAAAPF